VSPTNLIFTDRNSLLNDKELKMLAIQRVKRVPVRKLQGTASVAIWMTVLALSDEVDDSHVA
jgi:hypothetical protein